MRQTAQVKRILSDGLAEVSVTRQGACSHNCADCAGCSTAVMPTLTARAQNRVGAQTGDLVLVETSSAKVLQTAAFVYLVPMVLLIAGYLAGQALGLSGGLCIMTGVVAFAASMGLILLLERYVKTHHTFEFSIVGFQNT